MKYVLYPYFNDYQFTTEENYQARISNARLFHTLHNFSNIEEAKEYMITILNINENDIIIK